MWASVYDYANAGMMDISKDQIDSNELEKSIRHLGLEKEWEEAKRHE